MPSRPKMFGGGARHGATDFFQLSVAYAKQELLGPVVRQVKTMGKGIAGAVLLATGTVLLGLGFVRALQAEFGSTGATAVMPFLPRIGYAPLTRASVMPGGYRSIVVFGPSPYGSGTHLSGDWSWVPYMGGALFCLLVAGFCVTRVLKASK